MIQCYGRKSCLGTTLEAAGGLYAYGWFAVKQAVVTNTPKIYALGYNSLSLSTIYSTGLDNMLVQGYGYRSLCMILRFIVNLDQIVLYNVLVCISNIFI